MTSYLDHRDNTDGKCTITLLDSNLVTTDSFNIKVQNYNPEKYYFLMYLNQKDDTVIIKNAIYGGAVYFFFTKKKLLMKRYSYSPDYYDFSRDSVAHSKNYYSFSDINDGIKYDSDYKIERFENINEISKKDDVYIINEYTFFIENGLVTQLKNGDIVFYKFCESVEDE
ncbi:hypothetical protein [Bernardetia litoralis]|uniref:hypothetical protein n=1 Tax=Bernardetia litoralis TaxID=999 RepID=UPI0012FD6FAC|nr:hypothetical protein [Bernardetia litoralis]